MPDLLHTIGELKTQAKNRRDLKRYDRAVALLAQAINLAEREFQTTSIPEWRAALASELADCWGILGGVERRHALDYSVDAVERTEYLQKSANAYDKGHRYEADPSLGATTSTYNQLNRLLVRLLINPNRLTANWDLADQEPGGMLNVRAELEAVARQLEVQGAENVWAAADLALLNVLLGRQDAATAYTAFEKKEPPDFACQSALDGLTPLAALNLPTAVELKSAEQHLTALRDRMHAR
jgi:hypothetical protein